MLNAQTIRALVIGIFAVQAVACTKSQAHSNVPVLDSERVVSAPVETAQVTVEQESADQVDEVAVDVDEEAADEPVDNVDGSSDEATEDVDNVDPMESTLSIPRRRTTA